MDITINKAHGIATITLNRADKLNALSAEMYHDLADLFADLASDAESRCVVFTGSGRAFCAGGDVGSMSNYDFVAGRRRSQGHQRMINNLYTLEKPVIAAIRGPAAGIGASIALACDLVVASETAYFLMSFKKVGIPPDGGAVFLLTQHLGIARAKELIYTARKLPAAEAKEMGLVMKVVSDEHLESESQSLAQDLATSASYALGLTKKLFQSMYTPTLETLLETEALAVSGARLTHDHKEGIQAFLEKRAPQFLGY